MDIFSNYLNILRKTQSKTYSKPHSNNQSKIQSKTQSKIQSKTQSKLSSKIYNQNGGDTVCNKGVIMKPVYTTKTGKFVKEKCIPEKSYSGIKTSSDVNKFVHARELIQKQARRKFSKEASKKCPSGYIMREGYKREGYKSTSKKGDSIKVKESWTKPQCIKSQTLNRISLYS